MAERRDLQANQRPPRMDIGDRPGLGFVPPTNREVAGRQPPAATDLAYTEAYETQREVAWDLYQRGGSGSVAFPWLRTQTGEIGRWILEIGWAQSETHKGATVIRVVEVGNPFSLPPERLLWTPAGNAPAPPIFYRVPDEELTFGLADLHPEAATLLPPRGHPAGPAGEGLDHQVQLQHERRRAQQCAGRD